MIIQRKASENIARLQASISDFTIDYNSSKARSFY